MASLRVVVVGGGRVGTRTAELLDDRGHDVVVVEEDPDRVEALSDEYIATVIQGDATRPSILEQAGLDRADALAALTGRTGVNLATCMVATRLESGLETVMRTDREVGDEYAGFVDAVTFPERAGARATANAIEHDVQTLTEATGALDILEVRVAEGAPVAGRALADVALPRGSLVVSDAAGDTIAGPETVLEPGQSYVLAVAPDVADEVMNLMRG
ncbi:potassium channel family protein [Haloglomus litoreum]|uniref:potassium channel family protein n=1 Tax=Haloglomus litoreum TaxID=3034026 RepID=UPI0023E82C7B|nr:TrkA family potassium uptake protein [Haloglomus sp. DT116]